MRTIHLFAAVAAGTALLASPVSEARAKLTPEQQLDKLLAGRVAEKPVDCITLLGNDQTEIIDKTAIVYGSGDVIYVNRPTNPQALDSDDILVTEIRGGGSQLCSVDTVRLHDRTSHFYNGFVGLQQFVPYRRVKGT